MTYTTPIIKIVSWIALSPVIPTMFASEIQWTIKLKSVFDLLRKTFF